MSDEALEAVAKQNKEMIAWAFGIIVAVIVAIFFITQVFGPK